MAKRKTELDKIREITNPEPAPEAAASPPMRCPACGAVMEHDGTCKNEGCDNFEA